MSCLVGCVKNFVCNEIKSTIDGDSVTPYVKLFFGNPNEPEITVGNKSSPKWDNTASIQSFEMGASNGVGFSATILDQQGGAFHLFMEKLNKCMARSSSEYKMAAEWGWVVTNCDGTKKIMSSPRVVTLPVKCETVFAEGKVKFNITGTDLMQSVFVTRSTEIEGTDTNKQPLKVAIRNLCQNEEPKINVRFLRIEKDGTTSEYGFPGSFLGPKAVWDSDGQDKLSIIQKWLEPFVTDRQKGIVPVWDSSEKRELVLVEDPTPGCGESNNVCNGALGTYIVNGGKCSPVISFNPHIDWVMAMAGKAVGGTTNAASGASIVKDDKTCPVQTKNTGTLQSIPLSSYAWNVYGPKQSGEENSKGQDAQAKANSVLDPVLQPITAELRIQGDPSENFVHPFNYIGKYISIIVINPFHLLGNENNGCGDWLAQPGCNEILSNKNWLITGCSHNIKEGSYVTTLQIKLVAPGISLLPGEPFGGPGSEGYVPKNAC